MYLTFASKFDNFAANKQFEPFIDPVFEWLLTSLLVLHLVVGCRVEIQDASGRRAQNQTINMSKMIQKKKKLQERLVGVSIQIPRLCYCIRREKDR